MENLLFLDVEATGTEDEDRLIQVAYRHKGQDCNELFKPPRPIKLPAMAVHHVTEQMLEGKPTFKESPTKAELFRISETDAIFVAHNAKYDLTMLAKEGVKFLRHICTLKIARYIDDGNKFENHQLQYLRYFYGVDVEAVAHDAFGDIVVLEAVFLKLYVDFVIKEYGNAGHVVDDVLHRMVEISALPSLYTHWKLGKYRDKPESEQHLASIAAKDRSYLEYLLASKLEKPQGEEDWIYTLKHYLQK